MDLAKFLEARIDEDEAAAGYKEVSSETADREALEMACKAIAAVWSDHPHYDEGWRP